MALDLTSLRAFIVESMTCAAAAAARSTAACACRDAFRRPAAGAAWGFMPGEWGRAPLDQFGRPLYGDVFGVRARARRRRVRALFVFRSMCFLPHRMSNVAFD